MKIKSISEFCGNLITEKHHIEKDNFVGLNDKFVIVCVSSNPEKMYEIQYLRDACVKCGAEFIYVNLAKEENFVKVVDGDCVLCVGERMYKLDKNKTLIVKRHAHMKDANVTHNVSILAKNDFLIVNSSSSILLCSDKAKTTKKFIEDDISYPKSLILDKNNIDNFDSVMSNMKFEYPVIAKVNKGSQGNGVFLFDTPQSLKGVAQYIISPQEDLPCSSIIVQEKIDAEYDLRLHVLRKESDHIIRNGDKYEVFAAMKRKKLDNDYRSNVSLGSDYEEYEPTDDEKELAIKAAKSMGCIWCGVDLMRDKKTKKLYVLEVNCTPSLKGITNVSSKDPATEFVKAMKEAFMNSSDEKSSKEKMTLGYKEIFYINDFDMPLVGLLDTGNGSLTSLRVDDVKVNKEDNTVEWTLFGKKFKTKYDGDVKYTSSGGDRVSQPTTRIDITHNGVTYKNTRIKLSSIVGSKHKDKRVLNVNRKLLSKMNAIVDTSKKHVNSK